ncbi:hypothetical protein FA048_10380 [Pedobacter polaris]|uniref:Toxin-antitoxin system YwqK family antitoxin n=1 Tax=Pedobacter polaris TaxID=2571273 RepID=A0A4U1CX13_9SPHI|nr:hypothetical protein [Pedobacter polaris]TKC10578.1 hypothetical protein FA048_10380 [Pedobacter polaris]
MKIFSTLFILFICSLNAFSQVRPIYLYGNQVTKDKDKATSYAVYGKISTEDVWTFKRYDLYDNLIQTGSYADESLTMAHGKFTFYSDITQFNNIYQERFALKGKTRFISQEGNFVNGLEQGKWFLFYPDGNVLSAQEFLDGKMHGIFITYDRFGVAVISGNYVNGEKHGEWSLEKGKVREVYDMGILKSREYTKKGKIVKGSVTNKNS